MGNLFVLGVEGGQEAATLDQYGHRVRYSESVSESLALLREEPCEVVLIDGRQYAPELTGLLRSMCDDLECLLVCRPEEAYQIQDALQNGISDFIILPVVPEIMHLRIQLACKNRLNRLQNRIYEMTLEDRVLGRTKEVWEKKEELKRQFLATIEALEVALEAKHDYTEGHSRRVADMSVRIAEQMGLNGKQVEHIKLAALFHDIGKIGIRDNVLNKQGRLTEEEFEHIKTHPLIAERILAPLEGFQEIIDMIKYEHERFDGQGYPYRIAGEDIPLGARIIAVADAYDALVTTRSYRKGTTADKAMAVLRDASGTQFDSEAVEALDQLIEAGNYVFVEVE